MAKQKLVWFPGAIYNIVCHCFKNRTFLDDKDFFTYLSLLENVRCHHPFYLHSYCLIPDSIHLLLETNHCHVEDVMKELHHQFSHYVQNRYFVSLPSFQQSCSFTLIDSADEFLLASKNIHLAPFQASIVTDLKKHYWSSYQSFISHVPNDHVVTSRVLSFFPEPKRKHYLGYVEGKKVEAKIL